MVSPNQQPHSAFSYVENQQQAIDRTSIKSHETDTLNPTKIALIKIFKSVSIIGKLQIQLIIGMKAKI